MTPVRTSARRGTGDAGGHGATDTARPPVPTVVGHARTTADAEALAARLQRTDRAWPVVVVSTPRDRGPSVDPHRVLDEVRGLAEVVVVHTGEPSWAFSHGMPPGTQVYGGASRVYPVGVGWVHDLSRSPVWFADDDAGSTRVHERLVQGALTAAATAGLAGGTTAPAGAGSVGAVVLGVIGTRALVRTAAGATAQVAQELTWPVVPIDRLLAPGMRVRGRLDPGTRRFDVRDMLPDATAQLAQVHDACPPGAVVPAQVHHVTADSVLLALAPAVTVRVAGDRASRGDDDLRDLFSVGETVAARVLPGHPVPGPAGGTLRPDLRLDDVADTDPVLPALSLLDGGPSWLPEPAHEPLVSADPEGSAATPDDRGPSGTQDRATDPSRPLPGPGPRRAVPPRGSGPPPAVPVAPTPAATSPDDARPQHGAAPSSPKYPAKKTLVNQLELSVHEHRSRADRAECEVTELRATAHALELEVTGLRDLAREQRDRLDRLHDTVERYKATIRSARKERHRTARPSSAAPERCFVDPEDQLRFDVLRTWVEIIGPDEKARYPLPDFAVGPRFCDSLADVGRGLEDRVHRAVVLVLTGRAPDVPGFELHRLRRGDGGGSPHLVREHDGAHAMRLSLQVSSPQARRLHYWVLPGGEVELSRVVLHDDIDP
ncbi:hypothetical protein GCM10009718_26360 [Isoptericola halotolerans]|uniref:S1 motif domain-containing protein n=1 Tax=Isoptericola halotolerans TaxID=300560 RepID=A0ABX2A4K8_9MICO|nr:hypothetical protein [Isoptericola halotolerans]NOV97511.1 hypothetical protein [Isoptericola halotolerans]